MNTPIWFPILDRRLLAEGLQREIDDEYDGRLAAAARVVGIERLTLRRLVNQECSRIKKETFLGVMKLLPVDSPSEAAFITRAHVQAMRSYEDWAIVSASQIAQVNPVVRMYTGQTKRRAEITRADDIDELTKRVRYEARRVAGEICRGLKPAPVKSPARYLLLKLGGSAERPGGEYLGGVAPERYVLAFYRIIQPLLESQGYGNIERHHSELEVDAPEFQQFIEAGWAREKILLRREADRLRPQRRESSLSSRLSYGFEQDRRVRHKVRARAKKQPRHHNKPN